MRFLLLAFALAMHCAAQIPSGHHLVATRTPAAGTALLDLDTATGAVRILPPFALDRHPPLACTWDPIARHAIVAVATPAGSVIVRVDPRGGFERVLATLADPVIALELEVRCELRALTGGPNGAIWSIARNGSPPSRRMAIPHATALGAPKLWSTAWVAQAPPGGPPTVGFVDPHYATWLVAPIAIPGLAGRRITGVFDLPTAGIREVLTDDRGGIHLLEFATTLRTLPVTPPLPPGAAVDLIVDQGALSIDAVVLGDARHPFVHRVPVFGGTPTATRLAGPLPGDPIDFDLVDSAAGWGFGRDCGGSFGAKSLLVPPGGTGRFRTSHAPRSAPALAVFGVSEQRHGTIPLPFALPGGCPLLVSPDVIVPTMTASSGVAQILFPVPGILPRGFAMYAQWVFPDATGAAMTSVGLSSLTEP